MKQEIISTRQTSELSSKQEMRYGISTNCEELILATQITFPGLVVSDSVPVVVKGPYILSDCYQCSKRTNQPHIIERVIPRIVKQHCQKKPKRNCQRGNLAIGKVEPAKSSADGPARKKNQVFDMEHLDKIKIFDSPQYKSNLQHFFAMAGVQMSLSAQTAQCDVVELLRVMRSDF